VFLLKRHYEQHKSSVQAARRGAASRLTSAGVSGAAVEDIQAGSFDGAEG
jgi:hypothetical protein